MALINCSNCGKQISDRAVKCPHCGFVPGSSEGEQSVSSLGQQEQNTAPKKTHKKLWIVIMALLAVMAIFWFLVIKDGTKTKTPSNFAVSEYYNKENPKKTQPTSPNDEVLEIKQVLNSWVEYHNEKNVERLMTLYADQVEYFLANYTKEQVRNSKQNALEKNPQFQMTVSNVNVEKQSSYYKVSFDKLVQMNPQAKAKTYPSYLHIQHINGLWKIIKESDLVTEEKRGQQNETKMVSFPYDTYYTGTIGSKGSMRIDQDGNGSYTYDCNGTDLTRNIKVKSYDSATGHLFIESYDKNGKYIGQFDGYTSNGNSYSGTFTNYKGGKVDFRLYSENGERTSSQNNYVVIDGSELRLRLGPSTSADTFKWGDGTNRHPKVGEKFKYLGESGDFYQIDFHGHRLWVSKLYTHIE